MPKRKAKLVPECWAVAFGVKPGVYFKEKEAYAQAKGFDYPLIKPFQDVSAARDFVSHFQPSDAKHKLETVYTDGACSKNGRLGATAGVGVFWGPDDARNVSRPTKGLSTNNVAELEGIEEALEQMIADPRDDVEYRLVTDSGYAMKALLTWYDTWKRNGFCKSNGEPVLNLELIQRTKALIDKLGDKVRFFHVRGHQDIQGNEAADDLAVAGKMMKLKGPISES